MDQSSPNRHQDIHIELQDLWNLWNAYVEDVEDNPNHSEIHGPPALTMFQKMVIENSSSEFLDRIHRELPDLHQVLLEMLGTYGNMLFHFAQWALMRGVYYGNLTPCKCGTREVEQLLNEIFEES